METAKGKIMDYYEKARKGRSLVSDSEGVYFHQEDGWCYSDNFGRTLHPITEEQKDRFIRERDEN